MTMDKIWVILLCFNFAWCHLHEKNAEDKCDDCVPILECKAASPYLNPTEETLRFISKFFCGIKNTTFNVCCTNLKDYNKKPHPNLNLLPDNCGNIFNGIEARIINRVVESDLNEFPWMVPIFYYNQNDLRFICSGTIINSRYVLTAAHCVKNADIASIRVGEHHIGEDVDCRDGVCGNDYQDTQVNEAIIHEDYDQFDNNANDIALLRLAQNVNMTFLNAGTICLPITEELQSRTITNRYATIAGWVNTEYNQDSRMLLKEIVAVRSIKQCHKFYSYMSTSNTKRFCAGRQRDSCERGSGGLMIQDSYKGAIKMVQYGITSLDAVNCGSGLPGVYTDVRSYMKWILDNIRE